MQGCRAETSRPVSVAAGSEALAGTLAGTRVGIGTQHSGVFVQVEFDVDVDEHCDAYVKESTQV